MQLREAVALHQFKIGMVMAVAVGRCGVLLVRAAGHIRRGVAAVVIEMKTRVEAISRVI